MHNGKIRNEDMLMLRILFDNGKSDRETVNKEIYQFVKKQCLQAQLVRKSNTKE